MIEDNCFTVLCWFLPYVNKPYIHIYIQGFPGGSVVKNLPASAGDVGSIPESKDPLETEMATLSSILAWEAHGQGTWQAKYSMGSQNSWIGLSS